VVGDTGSHIAIEKRVGPGRFLFHGAGGAPLGWFDFYTPSRDWQPGGYNLYFSW